MGVGVAQEVGVKEGQPEGGREGDGALAAVVESQM